MIRLANEQQDENLVKPKNNTNLVPSPYLMAI
ncbi:hypothetical protein J2W95_000124 [Flavobacterium granuli]|uniref:Uncharacterized protein n=1 Tax=Flavobacterium granuli TaxID=280093 RepID=A0ABU1RXE9_9FLAO|nr:hypothetical protein [Flavobacterium granuli]